jgi:hypothetical protein
MNMEKVFFKIENTNYISIHVYPFNVKDILSFFPLESSIVINNAYIRIFGNEKTNSVYETALTEEGLYNFKTLNQFSELCNLPFVCEINELELFFIEFSCTIKIDDLGAATFQIKNDSKNILKRLSQYYYSIDEHYLYDLMIKYKSKYVCFSRANLDITIYRNLNELVISEFR